MQFIVYDIMDTIKRTPARHFKIKTIFFYIIFYKRFLFVFFFFFIEKNLTLT
jgi:hypothetical protein